MNIASLMFLAVAVPVGLYLSIGGLYFISWTSDLVEKQDEALASVLLAAVAALLWPLSLTVTSTRLSFAALSRRHKINLKKP